MLHLLLVKSICCSLVQEFRMAIRHLQNNKTAGELTGCRVNSRGVLIPINRHASVNTGECNGLRAHPGGIIPDLLTWSTALHRVARDPNAVRISHRRACICGSRCCTDTSPNARGRCLDTACLFGLLSMDSQVDSRQKIEEGSSTGGFSTDLFLASPPPVAATVDFSADLFLASLPPLTVIDKDSPSGPDIPILGSSLLGTGTQTTSSLCRQGRRDSSRLSADVDLDR